MKADVIEALKSDNNYYGAFGRRYMSNSDVGTLLNNPQAFGLQREDDKALATGRLFHQMILEPEKVKDVIHVDVSTRNTKAYKEAVEAHGVPFLLLTSEVEEISALTKRMTSNIAFFDAIYDHRNDYEVPEVGEIAGLMWKGKADIVAHDRLIDLKTTSDINAFKWSAKKYNYDSQAYIYGKLFGKPLVFYVVDKETGQLGVFNTTPSFLRGGEEKVKRAVEVYNRYFAEGAPSDIINHFIFDTLD